MTTLFTKYYHLISQVLPPYIPGISAASVTEGAAVCAATTKLAGAAALVPVVTGISNRRMNR